MNLPVQAEQTGVLVIAHGSRDSAWVRAVEDTVEEVELGLPLATGYLELVEGKSIREGVRRLERAGVRRIVAVPLFVSSGSTHLEEIRYALGVNPTSRISTDLSRIPTRAVVQWAGAMDDHPYVLDILSERVRGLTTNARRETLLLITHGSEHPGFREIWEQGLKRLTVALRQRFGFASADYAMLADGSLEETARRLIRNGRLLVVPLFLSEGYFTSRVIPEKLKEISCRYNGKTLLPHPKVARWVESSVVRCLADRD